MEKNAAAKNGVFFLLLAPGIACAQGRQARSPPEFARWIDELKPGQCNWVSEKKKLDPAATILMTNSRVGTRRLKRLMLMGVIAPRR